MTSSTPSTSSTQSLTLAALLLDPRVDITRVARDAERAYNAARAQLDAATNEKRNDITTHGYTRRVTLAHLTEARFSVRAARTELDIIDYARGARVRRVLSHARGV